MIRIINLHHTAVLVPGHASSRMRLINHDALMAGFPLTSTSILMSFASLLTITPEPRPPTLAILDIPLIHPTTHH